MPEIFEPAKLGPLTLRNRIIKAATFEGRTPDALVSDDLIEFHRAVAAGGAAMTTVAYCAVAPEGRTERRQIYMRRLQDRGGRVLGRSELGLPAEEEDQVAYAAGHAVAQVR